MTKLAAGLLILAVVLLALSFAERPDTDAAVAAPVLPVASPSPTPAASMADTGRLLFQTKGCTACHRHDGLNLARVSDSEVGDFSLFDAMGAPDLTHYPADPEFLRVWLKSPQAVRPETGMPNLGLKEVEIEALIAFLETNR